VTRWLWWALPDRER